MDVGCLDSNPFPRCPRLLHTKPCDGLNLTASITSVSKLIVPTLNEYLRLMVCYSNIPSSSCHLLSRIIVQLPHADRS